MIIGIGNDLVSVKRIKNTYSKFGSRFEKRVYSHDELRLIWNRGSPCFKTLSNRWAVKEAFVKALGTGVKYGILLKDISTLNNSNGKPLLIIKGHAKSYLFNILPSNSTPFFHVSISDEKDFVNAVVIIEARDIIFKN